MEWFNVFYIHMVIFHYKEKWQYPVKFKKNKAMQLGEREDRERKIKFSQTLWRYKVEIQSF